MRRCILFLMGIRFKYPNEHAEVQVTSLSRVVLTFVVSCRCAHPWVVLRTLVTCSLSLAHQLHQPRVRHPVHGRPQQPQLPGEHRREEGAAVGGRRRHERPAGVKPCRGMNCHRCPAPPQTTPAPPRRRAQQTDEMPLPIGKKKETQQKENTV